MSTSVHCPMHTAYISAIHKNVSGKKFTIFTEHSLNVTIYIAIFDFTLTVPLVHSFRVGIPVVGPNRRSWGAEHGQECGAKEKHTSMVPEKVKNCFLVNCNIPRQLYCSIVLHCSNRLCLVTQTAEKLIIQLS